MIAERAAAASRGVVAHDEIRLVVPRRPGDQNGIMAMRRAGLHRRSAAPFSDVTGRLAMRAIGMERSHATAVQDRGRS